MTSVSLYWVRDWCVCVWMRYSDSWRAVATVRRPTHTASTMLWMPGLLVTTRIGIVWMSVCASPNQPTDTVRMVIAWAVHYNLNISIVYYISYLMYRLYAVLFLALNYVKA